MFAGIKVKKSDKKDDDALVKELIQSSDKSKGTLIQ